MTKRALISVWNKDKIVEFATELTEKYNYEIIATGSTFDLLKQNRMDYEFRTTLVAGLHTQKSIQEMASLLKGAKKLYLQRFVDAPGCLQKGLTQIPKAEAENFKEILSKQISSVLLRGYN